jgi:DNA-binding MarR family transcriptional regulator
MPVKKAPSPALLQTQNSPFYQIWVLTNLVAKPFMASYGAQFHLNLTQWRVMLTIADRPGITAQALSDYCGMDKMSVSRVVRSLESQERLERRANQDDLRTRHLFLTAAGRKVYQAIVASAVVRERAIFADLSVVERAQLLKLLGKLSARARASDGSLSLE